MMLKLTAETKFVRIEVSYKDEDGDTPKATIIGWASCFSDVIRSLENHVPGGGMDVVIAHAITSASDLKSSFYCDGDSEDEDKELMELVDAARRFIEVRNERILQRKKQLGFE